MTEFEYCMEHLGPHERGWCTVDPSRKKTLMATSIDDAYSQVRALGWPIFQEGERCRTWNLSGQIVDHGPRR